ncbi:MAG: methyltransferase domain-containing protein [Acidobacteria bacterium]|nr:methyltransferase domain-containing protein [Acidobacteriota bacterium]
MPNPALTRNKMGWHARELSPLSLRFVEFCRANPGIRVLDIGAGGGLAAHAAHAAGARVVAVDLEPLEGPFEVRLARFPAGTVFDSGSFDAVHAASVFHFLTGNQFAHGLRNIANWLRPGGKLFAQTATPYQQPFASFIAEFEQRKAESAKYPGWIAKASQWSAHKRLGNMPASLHLFDDQTMRAALQQAGLEVESCELHRRPDLDPSLWLDGRETLSVVAAMRPIANEWDVA